VLVTLALAAGNHDPVCFPDPDRFDPLLRGPEHLGFEVEQVRSSGKPLAGLAQR
jgi:cytochrome P450